MLNLFQKTSSIHSYNTQLSTSGQFYVRSSRLEIQNNSFSCLGVKLWNEIPRYKLYRICLRKLSKEED